ncbi:hypothetical protein BRADI_5g24512v3 [Brachypodium distachyon]|uniref:Uncharacterized protein n=1 Tax=Brachypodium distachyon TaxID=15368 RepID=A0A0Q3P7P1_BRADI|nr:hypothetical protein BRADI_5g24512v3 [Brachypodium distachyon]
MHPYIHTGRQSHASPVRPEIPDIARVPVGGRAGPAEAGRCSRAEHAGGVGGVPKPGAEAEGVGRVAQARRRRPGVLPPPVRAIFAPISEIGLSPPRSPIPRGVRSEGRGLRLRSKE